MVDTGDRDVLYHREDGQGPPVVLLHGNAASHRWWDGVSPLLRDRYRVMMPDLPGFGQSPLRADIGTVEDVARVVVRWARHRSVHQAHWVGHSLGGAVAMQIALDAPTLVRSLTLVDPAPPDGMPLSSRDLEALADIVRDRAIVRERLQAISPAADHGPVFDTLVDEAMKAGGWVPMARALAHWNIMARVASLTMPILLLHGEHDQLVPFARLQPLSRLPQVQTRVLPGVGHCLPIEDPARLAHELVRFWGTLGKGF
jgi:pimeloyl-ACP methyl ester carboxylesterase